jgi:hypothetical protein
LIAAPTAQWRITTLTRGFILLSLTAFSLRADFIRLTVQRGFCALLDF